MNKDNELLRKMLDRLTFLVFVEAVMLLVVTFFISRIALKLNI